MKKLIFLGIGLALCLIIAAGGLALFLFSAGGSDNDAYFQTSGDEAVLKKLMKGTGTDDWSAFFKATGAEGQVMSVTAEKKRFMSGLVAPKDGEFSPGEVRLKLAVKDLRKNAVIVDDTFTQQLPAVVIKGAGQSAQEAAYEKAERELFERMVVKMQTLVYTAMLNYPDEKEVFLPIMEERINDPVVSIKYAAGRAMLTYGDDAVPALVRAAYANPENGIVCGALVRELKEVSSETVPELEKLLKHPAKQVRGAAVGVLSRFMGSNEAAKTAVMNAMKGGDHDMQVQLLTAIKELGPKAASLPEVHQLLLQLMLTGKKGSDWRASKALCAMGEPAYPILMEALNHESLHNQLKDDIFRETPEEQRTALFPILMNTRETGSATQNAGAELLLTKWSYSSPKTYYQALTDTAESDDKALRLAAVHLLTDEIQGTGTSSRRRTVRPECSESLLVYLKDTDSAIRDVAAKALLALPRSAYASKARDKATIYKLKTATADEKKELIKNLSSRFIEKDDLPIFYKLAISKDPYLSQRGVEILLSHQELKDTVLSKLADLLPRMSYDARKQVITHLCQKDYANTYLPVIFKASWDAASKKHINTTSLLYRRQLDPKHLPALRLLLQNSDTHERVKGSIIQLLKNFPGGGASETDYLTKALAAGKLKGVEHDLFSFFKTQGDSGLEGMIYCRGESAHTSSQVYHYLRRQDKAKVLAVLKRVHATTSDPKVKQDVAELAEKLK